MKKNIQLGMTSGNLTFAYPAVVTPQQKEEGKPDMEYKVLVLMDKTECAAEIAQLNAALQEVYVGSIADTWGNQQPAMFKNPLHDGDAEKPNNALYANKVYFNAKSGQEYPPALGMWDPQIGQVVNVDRMAPNARDVFYSGCKGALSLNISAYNTAGQKGIGIYMNGILKVKDGPRLSGVDTDPVKLFAGAQFGVNQVPQVAGFGQPAQPAFAQPQTAPAPQSFGTVMPQQQAQSAPGLGVVAPVTGMPQQGIAQAMMQPQGVQQPAFAQPQTAPAPTIPQYNPADQTSPFMMPLQ